MFTGRLTPVLRIFDVDKALEFYSGFLGFKEEWRHPNEPTEPFYIGVHREGVYLHLTEHFGDASPGTHLRIEVTDVDAFATELNAKQYRHARPGVVAQPWGNREMTIADPFGNRVTFWTKPPPSS